MSPEIKCGDMILKMDIGEPSHYAKNKSKQELRETPENIEKSLKELRKLLKDETDLVLPLDNDQWLIRFLRACKFYPQSTRDLIKRFYTLRLKYSEVTENLHPHKLKNVFEANLVSILPQRDQFGRRIIVLLGGETWDHRAINIDEIAFGTTLCSDAVQMEQETQIHGASYIYDLKGLKFTQTVQFTPYSLKRTMDYLQENVPLRIKGFHIVNQPVLFTPFFNLAKTFFTKKFGKRVFMHGSNYKVLHQHIEPEYLPECYGGTLKLEKLYGPETYQLLSHYEEYFETEQKYGFKKIIK